MKQELTASLALADALPQMTAVPGYLEKDYWWAYVHPNAVRVFERQWLVNAILWGNFSRLRDSALDALGYPVRGRSLQIACVYGDLTVNLADRLDAGASLDVVDVLEVQLKNLRRKLSGRQGISLLQRDSSDLQLADGSYDQVLLFFLLHEQPEDVRRRTLAEAVRVVKPGGKIVVVDYHRPHRLHPLYYLFKPVLARLEPYALDLWRQDIEAWLPGSMPVSTRRHQTFFGGLYQQLTLVRN